MREIKNYLLVIPFIFLLSCGDSGDDKVSKGHRESIKYQCKSATDVKACGLEARRNFLDEGNEFETLEELETGQIKKIKFECMMSKSFGLESYNNCLVDYKELALDGDLWKEIIPQTPPKTHIAELEQRTVVVQILYEAKDGALLSGGAGSGVIIKKDLIATNCHVTNSHVALSKKYKSAIFVKEINKKNYAVVEIYKEKQENDICIVKKIKDAEFSFPMEPVKRLISFSKLKKGDYVRTFGTPVGDDEGATLFEGHTAEGTINYLGTVKDTGWSWKEDLSEDTKLIVHSAALHFGNSGGPLFDKNGNLIGINSSGSSGDAAGKFNISVSADHIKELLGEK